MICTKRKVAALSRTHSLAKSEAKGGSNKGAKSLILQGNTKLVYSQTDGLIRVPGKSLEKSSATKPFPDGTATKSHKKTTVKRKIDE